MNRWNDLAAVFILVSLLLMGCAQREFITANTFLSSSPKLNIPVDQSFKYLGQRNSKGSTKSLSGKPLLLEEEYHVFIPKDGSKKLDRLLSIRIGKIQTYWVDKESENVNNIDLGIATMLEDTYRYFSRIISPSKTWQLRKYVEESSYQLPRCLVSRCFYNYPQKDIRVSICYYEDSTPSGMSCAIKYTRDSLGNDQKGFLQDLHKRALAAVGSGSSVPSERVSTAKRDTSQNMPVSMPKDPIAKEKVSEKIKTTEIDINHLVELGQKADKAGKTKEIDINHLVELGQKADKADQIVELGQQVDKAGRIDEAIELFTETLRPKSQSSDVYFPRGFFFFRNGQYAAAIRDFTAAINLDPRNRNAYRLRGSSYGFVGDIAAAMKDYDQAINLDPSKPDTYSSRGKTWFDKGDLTKAIEDYSKAIQLDSTYTLAYRNRADAYFKLKQYETALQDYEKIIASDPSDAEAVKIHTIVLLEKGKEAGKAGEMDTAIRVFTDIMRVAPSNPAAYYQRGIAFFSKEQFKEALQDFTEAIRLDSVDDLAYIERGVCYYQLDNFQQAIEDFTTAISLKPDNPRAYRNRGSALFGKGDYESAIRDYDTAISLDPKSALAYLNRAEAYRKVGRLADVVGDYDKAMEIRPDDPEILYKRGLAYWRLKKRNMALTDLRKAANLGSTEARDFLASQKIR